MFEERLETAAFNSKMRSILLECSGLDWSKISPAIFGSMFQSVMNPVERRNLGAHYTSEKNILKLIKPLFLDELYDEFEKVKGNANQLNEFHKKLSTLKFLDPACGCGNFLVITYRELRLLELEILRIQQENQQSFSLESLVWLDVDQFFGIEYDEFPARIAEVALWLMDHQMNMIFSKEFGNYFIRLPLKKSAKIVNDNALRVDWNSLIFGTYYDLSADNVNISIVAEPTPHYENVSIKAKYVNFIDTNNLEKEQQKYQTKFDYILGNPPFVGHHYQSVEQKKDMDIVFEGKKGFKVLYFFTAWYLKAFKYLNTNDSHFHTKVAFVSTNSIVQGEQIGLLWNDLITNYKISIHFAHRTFKWGNEAKGNAAVHVVIIGFSNFANSEKYLFEYEDIKGEPHKLKAKNISPYLVDTSNVIITNRSEPICSVPKMIWGNKPTDGGCLLFSNETEKNEFLKKEPGAYQWIKPFVSGRDFLNNHLRYCLWLKDITPDKLSKLPEVLKRIECVRQTRLKSKAEITRLKATTPTLFAQISQPSSNYLAIPEVSSENRVYIPIAYLSKDVIASNKIQMLPNADFYVFGVMTSIMHVIWTKYVCGRLESRISYSNTIVYNNFPWPKDPSEKNKKRVEEKAQKVLDVRKEFVNSSLADLYNPLTMPPKLVKAHIDLDKAVDLCYRPQPFPTEISRIEYLFYLYQQYTEGLFKPEKYKGKNK